MVATTDDPQPAELVLLGDEAVALGAAHGGLCAAYAYPGTPSTEILEYLIGYAKTHPELHAGWSINEKAAYEEALGVSMVGRRALVAMKHVGLNVAADPFMNSAVVPVNGGLVLAVADDPGMHSSQNEQDSRYYADFARILAFEPANQQEAYDMTREAFGLSERFQIPVMVRLVTRLAHSRAVVRTSPWAATNTRGKTDDPQGWILLPMHARRRWHQRLEGLQAIEDYTERCAHNSLSLSDDCALGVITTGIAKNYYLENLPDLGMAPSHLHIGAYPLPVVKIRALAAQVKRLLVIEEGYPCVERLISGILGAPLAVHGKRTGHLPAEGELTPDIVRRGLDLTVRKGATVVDLKLPERPPQLCPGCPHADTYTALNRALEGQDARLVTSDIGCYTLGALPPHESIESCVCMGASVSMAKGAADAGVHPVVAVIGDSTFLHSGITPLIDAVAADSDMTLLILDNGTVAMTGAQATVLPSGRLEPLLLGLGVDRAHLRYVDAHPKKVAAMEQIIREEIAHHGLSVVICFRACLETAKQAG
ncbi:MAG: indolepyruvate ferredoxin oxidoreductase subunit alpha [Deltaproteobacteria bacterium]|nr:indolepyruvate ferredoxin oxidoreductase subunit alpha [Deltaproteobacteria bacterium]